MISMILCTALYWEPDWIPQDLRDHDRYQLVTVDRAGRDEVAIFLRLSDDAKIYINCGRTRGDYADNPEEFSVISQSRAYDTKDGFPFSRQYVRDANDRVAFSRALDTHEFVRVNINGKYHREGVERWTEKGSFHQDTMFLEALCRISLAAYASHRLGEMQPRSVGGVSVKTWETEDGRVIDLTDFAAKAGIAIYESDDHSRVAFSYKGSNFIAPLGARKIKRGNAWIDLPEVIMLKSGHVLIPIEAFGT